MKTVTYIAIFFLTLASCTKEVTLELADQEGTNVVVDASINDDSTRQWVRLSLTSSYYEETEGTPVSNAIVEISGNNKTYVFTESAHQDSAGYYYNDDISKELVVADYELTITNGDETYQATNRYEQNTVLDSIGFQLSPFTDFANSNLDDGEDSIFIYDIYVYFSNPGVEEFYFFDRYLNRELKTTKPADKSINDTEGLTDYIGISVYSFNTNNTEPGDTLGVSINTISEEYYNFLVILFNQTDLSGNPFAGAPPANIPTNMSEGALGFFEISSRSYAEKVYVP